MPDIYDQLLDQATPSPVAVDPTAPAPKQDVYDELLDKQQAENARTTSFGLEQAAQVKPDRAVQVRSLAQSSGLPVEMVERNFDQVQRRDKALKMQSVLAASPVLAKQLRAPEFAGVALDDVENLAAVERTMREYGVLKAPTGPEASFGAVMSGFGNTIANMFPSMREGVRLYFADAFGFEDMQRDAMRRAAHIQMSSLLATPQFQSSTAQGLYGGATSVLQMIPSVAAALATRNPGVGLTIMGMQTGLQAYPKYRLRGGTPNEALAGATIEGGIEAATEMLPMSFIVKNLGRAGMGKFLSGFIGREAVTEQLATLMQDAVDTAIANPDKTWAEYAAERPDAAYQTLLGTMVASGVFGGMNAAARRLAGNQDKARIAEDGAQLIQNLNKLAAASQLQKIDAASFESFVEQAAQDGPVDDVYIDANVLMQSGLADQVAAVSPSVADQLEVAAQTGGTIKIPVAEYAATIAPTQLSGSLLDHLKVDPDGFSRLEAQAYMQSIAQEQEREIEQALAQQDADNAVQASVDVVRENIKGQLDAAKRFTSQVNDAYATLVGQFYATQAARLGVTPEELYNRYPLRVVAQGLGGQRFDQAAIESPEFKAWFGDSKVVDADGKPLVVYHGTSADVGGSFAFDPAKIGQQGSAEGYGFYFTTDRSTAEGYQSNGGGSLVDAFISMKKPMPLNQKGFKRADIEKIINHLIEAELERDGTDDYRDTFISNYVDTYSMSRAQAVREVAQIVQADPLATDQIAELGNVSGDKVAVHAAVRDVTGFDGIVANGYGDRGEAGGTIYVAWFPEQIKSATGNRGTFDPNNPDIFHQGPRGFFSPDSNTIGLLKDADLSTFLHESGHFFLEMQMDMAAKLVHQASAFDLTEGERQIVADTEALLRWFGVSDFTTWFNLDFEEKRSYHEKFARGFEAYLFEGKTPSIELQGLFQRFRAWLVNVYKKLSALNVELTDEVRSVMDRMLATDEEIKAAEYGRSMLPLFESAQQAGMTEEEFAAYQALGQDATQEAQAQLSERGLRDLKWLSNAKSRALKRLQKEAEALRAQERINARREIMSQPVYRAWQFLTGKVSDADRIRPQARPKSDRNVIDPTQDSLFVAIAKLGGIQRDQAQSEWGIDPKEKITPPVFGKPVLRKAGGLSLDDMRQALAEYGYLNQDYQSPDWDPNEFEWKFFDELGGSPSYSNQYDYYAAQQEQMAGQGLNLESLVAGRLSRPELRAIYGDADGAVWKALEKNRMVVNHGLHPDLVAELFGFTSGDELVQALAKAQPPEVEIEALTDLRMLERHGDLATPEALSRAADAAIHNDVRARVIAAEHKALNDAIGPRAVTGVDKNGRKLTTALVPQAAREFATTMVSRLKIRNVRPGQYAAAGSRAAKAAEKALREGNLEQAAVEKRNQLVNTYATKAAHDAITEVEKGLRYLKTFDNEGTRKNLDVDYLDQIDAMLARFDLRRGQSLRAIDKRTSLAEWIAARSDEGTEPDIAPWLMAEANREHYKNLTVEQFRGVVDAVKQIEHLARLKHRLLTSKDKRELDAIVDEIRTSINDAAGGRVIDNERRNTLASKAVHLGRWFMASHRKLANLAREMDGFKDGGPMWEHIIRPMNDAGNKEATMRADAAKRLNDLAKPILADGRMGGKGTFFPSVGRSFNRGERLAIALNWGNEGNRQRLLDGSGWTVEKIKPVLESLTLKEWQFVQGVWDFFESYRPEIAAKERRVNGKEPEWIEPTAIAIKTADGQETTLRGGYYPIKYDPNQSGESGAHDEAEAAKAQMRAAYTAATTRRSFTKTRAEAVKGRPLLLTFDGIFRGANEVIHDLAWHEWLIDANKLLKRLDGPMRTGYGAETVSAIKAAVKDIAIGDKPAADAVEASLNHIRIGATVTAMGWSLMTALQQPLGITQSIARVGAGWMGRGIKEFYGSGIHMVRKAEEVNALSEFMRNRSRTLNREIADVHNRLTTAKPTWQQWVESSFFVMIQKMQMLVDYPTWLGAYEKALADPANTRDDGTVDTDRAVRLADQAVIDSQGEGQTKDLAQVQRGGPALRLFTNFYSYFSTALNLSVDSIKRTDFKDPVSVMRLAGDVALIAILPTVLGTLIREGLKGGDDDDDLAEAIAQDLIGFAPGMFVGARELTGGLQALLGFGTPFRYSGPAGLRFISELEKFAQQVSQGELDKALLKSGNNAAGMLFHYPAGQVNRLVEGAMALIEGRTSNPLAPLVGVPYKR